MQIKEIILLLEEFAPLSLQESYDNAGLIVGDENNEISGVLICIDSIEAVVEEAIKKGCNLIIAHHPIVFSGIKKLTGKNYWERTIIKAIKNNIAIYAAHTNLDNIEKGVNDKIATMLGLTNRKILSLSAKSLRKLVTYCPVANADNVRKAIWDAGAGNIGNYDQCSFNTEGIGTFRGSETTNPFVGKPGELHNEHEVRIETVYPSHIEKSVIKALISAHPYEEVAYDIYALENKFNGVGAGLVGDLEVEIDENEFLNLVKTTFNGGVRFSPLLSKKIKRVALCGGSGSFLLKDAIAALADVFVTADFKYHQFFDADGKILIVDIGHYESEQFTKNLFYEVLNKKNYNFALHLSEINTNPINYL